MNYHLHHQPFTTHTTTTLSMATVIPTLSFLLHLVVVMTLGLGTKVPYPFCGDSIETGLKTFKSALYVELHF